MTLAELIQEVERNISASPGRDTIQRAEILRKLNIAQMETSRRLGVPMQYVSIPTAGGYATGAFSLPAGYHETGISYIEVVDVLDTGGNTWSAYVRNQRVPLLTITEANQRYPTWENDTDLPYYGPPFVIYDPLDRERGFQPVGLVSAKYRVMLTFRPEDMVLDGDEPWAMMDTTTSPATRLSGALPGYHRILSAYVSFEVMLRLGDSMRAQVHYSFYQSMMNEAAGETDPHVGARPLFRRGRLVL